MDCSEYFRDWAAIEYDALGVILTKVQSLYDYLQFKLVCKSWHFIALSHKHERPIITSKISQLPMLIVPSKDGIEKKHCFYDLTKNEIRHVDFKFPFNKRCCGSSLGWLIMVEETLDVILFNPFSGSVIRLPPVTLQNLNDGPDVYSPRYIVKAVLTKDPSLHPNDYMVVAIFSSYNNLCLMKANDKTWIYDYEYLEDHQNIRFEDVNVCNDTLYVVDNNIKLWKIEVENRCISITRVISSLNLDSYDQDLVYVVKSSKRELLLVSRFLDVRREFVKTIKFKVYKVSYEDGIEKVVKVKSLDGDAMFIGDNQSMCVSTQDFPNCLPNRIYFTDNCVDYKFPLLDGPQDAGVYNLEDKSFDKHYKIDAAHRNLPPPIWIVPTICC